MPDDTEDSWLSRNKEAIGAAAVAGASLLARRPIGKALSWAGDTAVGAPIKQLGQGVRGVFAPTSMPDKAPLMSPTQFITPEATTAREAEALIRAHGGRAQRATEQGIASLEPHWREVGLRPQDHKEQLVDYIETRSSGAKLFDPKLQPAADAIKRSYDRVRGELESRLTSDTEAQRFVNDYYRHQYKPKVGEDPQVFLARMGNAGFTKKRTIPTIKAARELGYEPITEDPIEMTMRYIQNAERYIARTDILAQAEAQHLVKKTNKLADPGVPKDWKPIFQRGLHTYYAPPGFARVWNNYTSTGFTGPMGDIYQPMRNTFNSITALELGLSGFHATTMALEGVVSEVARGVQQMFKGDKEALKTFAKAPMAPYKLWKEGKDVEKVWLGTIPGTDHMRRVVNLMEQAGGRAQSFRGAEEYKFSSAGSFLEAWRRGALKSDLMQDWQAAKQGFTPAAKAFAKNVGRTIDSFAEPLFKWYIPRLKNGAFYETMGSWLKLHPNSTVFEQEAMARRIWDSIDNRFGEVVQDNIFWDRTMKQIANLTMRSYSWNLGTVREIGGGVKDIASGDLHSPRAAYAIALPVVFGMMNAVYQGLKTGQAPQDMQDLMAPRTGGIDPATNMPERLSPVGYMKDVFGWYEHPVQEASAKLGTGPRLVGEALTGKDWRGLPIADPEATTPEWLKAYLMHVGEAFTPISIRNQYERKRGSEISRAEAFMGLRPAGRQFVDPEGLEQILGKQKKQEWKRKVRADTRRESYYATDEG